jgi:xylulokinase
MHATLGIDVGTSSVKVAAVAKDGTILAESSRPLSTSMREPGHVEQSPRDWWAAVAAATREIVGRLSGVSLDAVGLSGQLNGLVLIDREGEALGPAIIWLDTRAGAEAEALANAVGDVVRARAGTEISPIAVLAKLAWIARREPERLTGAAHLLFVKDYILFKLTGVVATDPSDASATGLMDIRSRTWIEDLCRAAGADPGLLPPIRPSCEIVGRVTAQAGAEAGLPPGLPVAPGGGDVAALAIGCGVVGPNVLGITLGTAGHVVLSADGCPAGHPRPGLWPIAHAEPSRTIWLGLVMSGGLCASWFHRVLSWQSADPVSFEALTRSCEDVPPGARGVSFIPFLEGVATPYAAPDARAEFRGLSSANGAPDMMRAVMEGVAFNVRDCVSMFEELGATIDAVNIAEGGARVPVWRQIIADVLGRPLVQLDALNASAVGAALMAQVAAGGVSLSSIAERAARSGRRYEPRSANVAAYDRLYARYRSAAAEIAAASRRSAERAPAA